ncbi:GTPase [Aerosakkonema funiforme]|uniref:GTPase n=1 Tax=Aerosakkonema funiforme TaxID=1246630 RepID=UPI0035BC80A2
MSNQQIREKIDKIQVELRATLKETINSVDTNLNSEERDEIENKLQELNELLGKLKTGLVYIALFGKTGVGKSSIINSLIGADVIDLRVENDVIKIQIQYKKELWFLYETPVS